MSRNGKKTSSWDPVAWARRSIEWERRIEQLAKRAEEADAGNGSRRPAEIAEAGARPAGARARRSRRGKQLLARA